MSPGLGTAWVRIVEIWVLAGSSCQGFNKLPAMFAFPESCTLIMESSPLPEVNPWMRSQTFSSRPCSQHMGEIRNVDTLRQKLWIFSSSFCSGISTLRHHFVAEPDQAQIIPGWWQNLSCCHKGWVSLSATSGERKQNLKSFPSPWL